MRAVAGGVTAQGVAPRDVTIGEMIVIRVGTGGCAQGLALDSAKAGEFVEIFIAQDADYYHYYEEGNVATTYSQMQMPDLVAHRDELRDMLNLIPKEDSAYAAAEKAVRGFEDEIALRLTKLVKDNVVIPTR